jgi:DtxR family transcriptional regulator, Mn-dependent transcriptional regulator
VSPSQAVETYLKEIFHLTNQSPVVTTSAVASRLSVASPSVSSMVKRLEADGLVVRDGAHGIRLTAAGERQAMRVVRRHRLVETFLHDKLGVPWHEVHDEAEALEHAISDRLEARIDAALGHPTCDPHGDPIPPADLVAHHEAWPDPITAVSPGDTFRVQRISDRSAAALVHLAELGIVPGTELEVLERDPFDDVVWVALDGRRHALGPTLAALVHGQRVTAPLGG